MAKSKTLDLPELPDEVKPAVSSTELIAGHIERLRASGSPQKVVALDAGFAASFLSDIKAGRQKLPFTRIVTFAVGAKLTRDERFELLHARLAEEHGGNIDLCIDTLAIWADELCSPRDDEARLVSLWREAREVHPFLHHEVLADPARRARVLQAMSDVIQEELKQLSAAARE